MPASAGRLVAKARATNKTRDEGERAAGFAAPGDCGPLLHLRTAIDAIYCGLVTEDWNAVAEGYVMLVDLHRTPAGGQEHDPAARGAA